MKFTTRLTPFGIAAVTGIALVLGGCFDSGPPPPPPASPPPAVVSTGPAAPPVAPPTGKAVGGSKFNKLFPANEAGYKIIYTQEKEGFAEANLEKNSAVVAKLSITDLRANPDAVKKYSGTTEKIGGYPAVTQGNSMTSILVGERYQVKAMTVPGKPFTPAERAQWLAKFKLADLAGLK